MSWNMLKMNSNTLGGNWNSEQRCFSTTFRLWLGGRLLDVGCGEGCALAFFREHGWSVKGVDFSSAGVEPKTEVVLPF
jgi:2-polyprenyl-3-methyl-5-hydroxy-6-metoxy-1,4-benzoquinol methylase